MENIDKNKLTPEEIGAKLLEKGKNCNFMKAEKSAELSEDELDGVAGGVGSWSHEHDGYVWSAVCNKKQTNNAMLEYYLAVGTACPHASEGATSCYTCEHLYYGNTGVPVED
ncbi:MAG: hypothetical protein FWH10_04265 [Oscillospiraceae bacterium]|nr:hypothetical protein [Oscillospiraceae bacterium]